jgi:hypothetical protein
VRNPGPLTRAEAAETERDIMHAIMLQTCDRVLWGRNNVGMTEANIRYGVGGKGGSDLLGVIRGTGRAIVCEVKRPGGKPTAEQQRFLDCIANAGGASLCASSVEEVNNYLDSLEKT